MKNRCYFVLITVLLFTACKSKKSVSARQEESNVVKKEGYEALSKRLNIVIAKTDNIKLYEFVADWLGIPHQLGKCTKSGIDCSCFVRLLYEEIYNQKISRSSIAMYETSRHIEKEKLQEGDIVFFNIKSTKVSHVGVYLKEGWFAHVSTSKGVMINNLSEKYYAQYYLGGGRF